MDGIATDVRGIADMYAAFRAVEGQIPHDHPVRQRGLFRFAGFGNEEGLYQEAAVQLRNKGYRPEAWERPEGETNIVVPGEKLAYYKAMLRSWRKSIDPDELTVDDVIRIVDAAYEG